MRIGVPKETAAGEHRVALVPEVVSKLKAKGLEVLVQSGAGAGALLPDTSFADAGAELSADAREVWGCEVVVKIAPPGPEEIQGLGSGSILIGFLAPLTSPQTTQALVAAHATALAMEAIPRISRAQSMDALSSQSNVAGYEAALLGAEQMGRFYPMLMTAAGTIPPAKVLVLGAGVSGLQALATAKRLGARTTGYDVRPEVAEQVRSLGAQWLDLGVQASGEGGYARELTDEERAAQQQALTDAIKGFDVVITTALVPGRPAPKLVTEEAVRGMKPGSVIVDLAGETGGNCELSEPGETVVKHDVKILAPLNLPSLMPEHASQLFARNVLALLDLLVGEDGQLQLDFDDEIVAGACIVRDGEIVHPGAKAAVEAAGQAPGASAAGAGAPGAGATDRAAGGADGDAPSTTGGEGTPE
jgi:proton-translocating NAD(P)+ transhydrogenase subunit alpha